MSFTRRQFLLTTAGSGIGFILLSFYEKSLSFWVNYRGKLVLPAENPDSTLYSGEV